jgi:hypothetical protein
MDVWYLNGWVALFQFMFGLTYAPLAATMSGLPIKDIPSVSISYSFQDQIYLTIYSEFVWRTSLLVAEEKHHHRELFDSPTMWTTKFVLL